MYAKEQVRGWKKDHGFYLKMSMFELLRALRLKIANFTKLEAKSRNDDMTNPNTYRHLMIVYSLCHGLLTNAYSMASCRRLATPFRYQDSSADAPEPNHINSPSWLNRRGKDLGEFCNARPRTLSFSSGLCINA